MAFSKEILVNGHPISYNDPTYFIADIGANHDGDLERAKDLIFLAKEAGADVAKFQHFLAEKIVSDFGFKAMGDQVSHQSGWKKSVFDIYKQYECNRDWTDELIKTAKVAGIEFMTSPYDFSAIDALDDHLPAYKIGSGDVTWISFIEHIAKQNKPVFLATGACDMDDVNRAVAAITKHNQDIVLMQCNTNYTGSLENFKYINLNVLKTYQKHFPGIILGLSDHSPGHSSVLGAISMVARVIEKHFTDDTSRIGPDHAFAMDPKTWREMVDRSRELEHAFGDGIKRIEDNEKDTVIVQRRCIRLKHDMNQGSVITMDDLDVLRPAPRDAYPPYKVGEVLGKSLRVSKSAGDYLNIKDVG